jgi:addiction module HigA family antidote
MTKEYLVTARPTRPPVHPGEILREDVLPALGISVTEAARELGITRQTLHRIMAGTTSITPETALRLGKFCGNGPDLWLSMQQNYDLWHAQRDFGEEIEKIPTRVVA